MKTTYIIEKLENTKKVLSSFTGANLEEEIDVIDYLTSLLDKQI